MIDDQTKQKLLDELEKTGNVWSSCAKLNIHRSTAYRWRENDKSFARAMDKAIRIGRENMNDFTEHALMTNVKKCNQRAIEYQLAHRHPAYRTRPPSNVVILHKKEYAPLLKNADRTLEDLLDDDEDKINHHRTSKNMTASSVKEIKTAEDDIDEFFGQGKYADESSGEPPALAPEVADNGENPESKQLHNGVTPIAQDDLWLKNNDANKKSDDPNDPAPKLP